jgi:putative transposase
MMKIATLQTKIPVPFSVRFLLTRMRNKNFYRRNLPHWIPRGTSIFVTWRLFGSLPKECLNQLNALRIKLRQQPIPVNVDRVDWELQNRKRIFSAYDCMLDQASTGPTWLKVPEIADLVQEAITVKYASFYKLWSYCVMSNHCHALLKPKTLPATDEPVAIETIMQRIKGYTAKEANAILGRTGLTFWQDESFDHWIRSEPEFERVVSYIENNPVKAGLVKTPDRWQWSSASERVGEGSGILIV